MVVDIQGATVQVLVNVRDVASAAGPAREQDGQQAPQGQQLYYLAAAVLAGGGLVAAYLLYSDQDSQAPDAKADAAQAATEQEPATPPPPPPPSDHPHLSASQPPADAKASAQIRPVHYALVVGAVTLPVVVYAVCAGFGAPPSAAADASPSTVQCA